MNNDLTNLMEQDFEENLASSVEKIDQSGLNTVAGLARQIRDQEKSIAELDRQLKEKKKSLLKLTDEDLPSVLAEMGISSFSLDDGSTVDVKNTYGASILVDNRPKAYDWLRENGYDDIIKNTVSSSFGRGEDDRANAFTAFAQKEGYFVNQKTEIHPQTLRAFIKERCEAGDDFPMDLFGAYIGQRAVIKGSK
jgi:hypothetical protein|tara:strand:+ start:841 stop:1422 length:582 start_codon:yes stop_codon:yes gene_type:complete